MAQLHETPLDERQWRSPAALYNLQHFYGGLSRHTVHMYFAESDFFDKTSNNWALFMQYTGQPWIADRDVFEARLRSMQGLEYMVVAEPERKPDGSDTGVYVVRKQNRRKRPGHEDEVTVLASFYVIGENIYQAASLEDIIGNKILAATTSLSKFFSIASSLPIYTSGRGYTYFPPSTSLARPSATSANASRRSSRANSPAADTAMLDASTDSQSQAPPQSQPGDSSQPQQQQKSKTNASAAATSISALSHSFRLFNAYKNEFMDTNPLVGEPGSFVFSSTARHVHQTQTKAQAQADAAAAAAAAAAKAASGTDAKGAGPLEVKTDSKPGTPGLAASPLLESAGPPKRLPKTKRSKSKAGTSPTSPTTPMAVGTPGKGAS